MKARQDSCKRAWQKSGSFITESQENIAVLKSGKRGIFWEKLAPKNASSYLSGDFCFLLISCSGESWKLHWNVVGQTTTECFLPRHLGCPSKYNWQPRCPCSPDQMKPPRTQPSKTSCGPCRFPAKENRMGQSCTPWIPSFNSHIQGKLVSEDFTLCSIRTESTEEQADFILLVLTFEPGVNYILPPLPWINLVALKHPKCHKLTAQVKQHRRNGAPVISREKALFQTEPFYTDSQLLSTGNKPQALSPKSQPDMHMQTMEKTDEFLTQNAAFRLNTGNVRSHKFTFVTDTLQYPIHKDIKTALILENSPCTIALRPDENFFSLLKNCCRIPKTYDSGMR